MAGSKKRAVEGDGKVEDNGGASAGVEPSAERGPTSKKSKSSHLYDASIEALDGSNLRFEVEKTAKGEVLLSKVVHQLNVVQPEYVGLTFKDETGLRCWLDIHKEIKHQLKEAEPLFRFEVKFYEPEPAKIKCEYTRYLLYLQLRDDIVTGKLRTKDNIYALLGSYTAQAECDDYNVSEHQANYLDEYLFSPEKSPKLTDQVKELHKEHRGQSPAQAELNFLEIAKRIPLYGVDIHDTEDNAGPCQLGMGALGVNVYRTPNNDKRETIFYWQDIDAITYKKRKLIIKVKPPERSPGGKRPQTTFPYQFKSTKACKQCYKSCVEYHTFFRLRKPDKPRKKTDSLKIGSSFRYSDRTLYEIHNQPVSQENGKADPFLRSPSKRGTVSKVGVGKDRASGTPDDEKKGPSRKDSGDGLIEPDALVAVELAPVEAGGLDLSDLEGKDEVQVEIEPETEMQYEEVEIDESNPDYDSYDPKEWEIVVKVMADGSKKRYRRRVITTTITTVVTTTYIVHPDGTEEEVSVLESKPIEEITEGEVDEADISAYQDIIEDLKKKEQEDADKKGAKVTISVSPIHIIHEDDIIAEEEKPAQSEAPCTLDEKPVEEEAIAALEDLNVECAADFNFMVDVEKSENVSTPKPKPKQSNVDMDDLLDEISALSKGLEDEEASILEENERKKREHEERDRQVAEATQALTLAEIEAKKAEEDEQARRFKEEEEEARRLGTITTITSEFVLKPKIKRAENIDIEVHSEAADDPGYEGKSSIRVNGVEYCPRKRGHNVVVLKPSGAFHSSEAFNTEEDDEGWRMATYLDAVPDDHMAIITVQDTGGEGVEMAGDALKDFGAQEPYNPGYRCSFVFIGCKNTYTSKVYISQVSKPRYEGPAGVKQTVEVEAEEDPAADITNEEDPDLLTDEDDEELEFVEVGDANVETNFIRTASLLRQQKADQEPSGRHSVAGYHPGSKTHSLDRYHEHNKRHSFGNDLDVDNYYKHRQSNSMPRKKLSADEEDGLHRTFSHGAVQEDVLSKREGGAEIQYTVTDTVQVEQGKGGFVSAVRARLHEEEEKNRRSSRHIQPEEAPNKNGHHPNGNGVAKEVAIKGHVPTRTMNFGEPDDIQVTATTDPPSISPVSTIIVPASSELPDEEVVFQINTVTTESAPPLDDDYCETNNIPSVTTETVVFDQPPPQDQAIVAPVGSEPGVIETRTVQIVPQTGPMTSSSNIETRHVVTTHQLPTQVVTKTITVEGDSSDLSPEELKALMEQAGASQGEDVEITGFTTTTQVVKTTKVQQVVTGQTITISGEGDPSDQDLQKMIQEALAKSGVEGADNVVITEITDGEEGATSASGDTEV